MSLFCADDTHGTAIMISAEKNSISEQEWIDRISKEHQEDFAKFGIEFDNYGSTNSPENKVKCDEIWQALRDAGLIKEKDVEQLFDPEKGIFLADRFVKGTCPKCGKEDQNGDSCECGHTVLADGLDQSAFCSFRSRTDQEDFDSSICGA